MAEEKILILLRHAHRDISAREKDNGLSEKGREQAVLVREYFLRRFGKDARASLLSSPKVRCRETLEPLARALGKEPITSDPRLDEQEGETSTTFRKRIRSFLDEVKEVDKVPIIVACTHGDWLPYATEDLLGSPIVLQKGGWIEVRWRFESPELQWVIQSFKEFFKTSSGSS